ncbi:MAG: transcriptional regulator MarR family [Candidatus Saccharibacteria bacterium]|nr:transcriptional regulator MarR family [Candidatus Saccharibacteria bacterium]
MTKNKLIEEVAGEFAELKRIIFHSVSAPLGPNVPPAQGQLLFLISKHKSLTVKEIAAELRISSGAVTQLVDGLATFGLVKREQDTQDRRIVHILLSKKGTEQVEQVRHNYLASFESTMGTLDDTELKTFLGILKKLNSTIAENKEK